MQITIFRGTHSIGGNCVEVRSGSNRLILDVGMPLVDADGKSFDSKTLRGKSVQRLLGEEVLPKVPGLFADLSDKTPSPDAILLSHSHTDHVGLIPYTRPAIPVHLSEGASKMLMAGSMFAGQAASTVIASGTSNRARRSISANSKSPPTTWTTQPTIAWRSSSRRKGNGYFIPGICECMAGSLGWRSGSLGQRRGESTWP